MTVHAIPGTSMPTWDVNFFIAAMGVYPNQDEATPLGALVGQVIMFAPSPSVVPTGWAACDGGLLAIASHTDLFSILGTNFGGDGRTTMGLPGFRAGVAMRDGTQGIMPSPPTVHFSADLEGAHPQIGLFAGDFVPRGWAPCDGRLLPVASHRELFSTMGARYGGEGQTTFALPDLRGRVALHTDADDGMGTTAWPGNGGFLIALEGASPERDWSRCSARSLDRLLAIEQTVSERWSVLCRKMCARGFSEVPEKHWIFLAGNDIDAREVAGTRGGLSTLRGSLPQHALPRLGTARRSSRVGNVFPTLGINGITLRQSRGGSIGVAPDRAIP